MSTRVAIYARVSTTNHGQDAGLQTREQHQFADARGWQVFDDYIDQGVSGSKDSRPELNRLDVFPDRRRAAGFEWFRKPFFAGSRKRLNPRDRKLAVLAFLNVMIFDAMNLAERVEPESRLQSSASD